MKIDPIDPEKLNPAIPLESRKAFARCLGELAPFVDGIAFMVTVTVGERPTNAKTTGFIVGSPVWRKQVAQRLLNEAQKIIDEERAKGNDLEAM